MYPLDVVKTRQQLSTAAKGTGIVTTLKTIVAQEGCVPMFLYLCGWAIELTWTASRDCIEVSSHL